MARRYTRDNRGRFASGGGGATARGGRLRTAAGNKRATQTMKAKGAGGAGVIKGRAARTVAGESAMRRLASPANASKSAPALKPTANLKQNKLGKVPPNTAKQRYKQAASAARAVGGDLRGASPMERRMANSKAAVVKNMERNRSTATAAATNSPKAAQRAREVARVKRAQSQYTAGMAREADGPGSKASRKVTVARRAMQIYSGKVDPKIKATARLTKTSDPRKLQDRIRRSAKLKTSKPAAPAKAKAAKPAKKTAEQRAQGVLARALAVNQKAKYDPRTRKEVNTSKTAVRAFAMYNDLGANPLRRATPQQLKTLGRNLKNKDKLKQVGAQVRWTSPRTKASDEAMKRREAERRGRYGLY